MCLWQDAQRIMKRLTKTQSPLTALAFAATAALFLSGCNNVGNENPITPEQMAEMSNKATEDRKNFKPPTSSSPATGGAPSSGGAPGQPR